MKRSERNDDAGFWMGVAALMLKANPELSPDDIEAILVEAAGDAARAVELAAARVG